MKLQCLQAVSGIGRQLSDIWGPHVGGAMLKARGHVLVSLEIKDADWKQNISFLF